MLLWGDVSVGDDVDVDGEGVGVGDGGAGAGGEGLDVVDGEGVGDAVSQSPTVVHVPSLPH